MPSLIKSLKGNKLINSSNIYDDGRLLNEVLENYRRIVSQMPTVDGEGESITLNGCINAEFLKFELGGNTSQEDGASLETPKDIHVVKGHNVITIANSDGTELKTLPLDLPDGMELCGINNYKDIIFENEPSNQNYDNELVENGWYKLGRIKKYVISNSDWINAKQAKEGGEYIRIEVDLSSNFARSSLRFNNDYLLCNYYKNKVAFRETCVFCVYTGEIRFIHLYDDNFNINMSATEIRNKFHELYDNKLCVYYVDESKTQITDPTLISQLEAIKRALSYAGTTIITQENEDLPFNISVSTLKDLHTLEYANYLNE